MNLDFEEFIDDFVSETLEHLRQTESLLLSLESANEDLAADALQSVFRCVHSVKGTSGFVGLHRINEVAHATENVLDLIRGSQLDPDSDVINALLKSIDQLRVMAENARGSSQIDVTEIVQVLNEVSSRASTPTTESVDAEIEIAELPADAGDTAKSPKDVAAVQKPTANLAAASSCQIATVRVPVAALDRLTQLAADLRSGHERMHTEAAVRGDERLSALSTEVHRLITELQHTIRLTTLQPIGNVFSRFTRVVRDLAVMLNKQCELRIDGADLTIPKALAEAIVDPLSHLVRNALDHGLEMSDVRVRRGKNPVGQLVLAASDRDGKLCIEIQDDGAGISASKVKSKAIAQGIISNAQALQMPDAQALRLIFAPGFSTAPQITSISGRGVGMDVVLTNIERLGGQVEIETTEGIGTTIQLLLPWNEA